MSSDINENEFSDFELEEIALGRGAETRRRLASRPSNDPSRERLAEIRSEVDRFRDVLESAADADDVRAPNEEDIARYLDGSLADESRGDVESALAGSADARRRLISLYRETRACVDGEPTPEPTERERAEGGTSEEAIVAYVNKRVRDTSLAVSTRGRLAGVIAAAAFVGVAYLGPGAWQVPAAFAAVVSAAMAAVSAARQVRSDAGGSKWDAGLVLIALTGLASAVVYPAQIAGACSIVGCALVLLYGRACARGESATFGVEEQAGSGAADEGDARKRRAGSG